jgi:hypothetical protein
VLARFDGEGLKAPAPEDLVSFVAYDPGSDPVPEIPAGSEAPTMELSSGLPKELVNSEDVVTKADPGQPVSGPRGAPVRGARSLLAFFFIALLAAAAGGIFVMKCERDQAARADAPARTP